VISLLVVKSLGMALVSVKPSYCVDIMYVTKPTTLIAIVNNVLRSLFTSTSSTSSQRSSQKSISPADINYIIIIIVACD
jgi:hypothetical protein